MKLIPATLAVLALAAPAWAQKESKKTWATYSRGLRVGLGVADMRSQRGLDYAPGLAFSAGVFGSFGWRGVLQVQPEASFVARGGGLRDEVLLMGAPSGLYRDTSFEVGEIQFGALLKLGKPSWTDPPAALRRKTRLELEERRHLPYLAGGAVLAKIMESKRVIRLDSSGAIPKSDSWLDSSRLRLEWVAAAGYEFKRHGGGGIGVEARWQLRDLPEETGLDDAVKLSLYTLQISLLF